MEPGWYRNPKDPDVIRYWDGARWSETRRSHRTQGQKKNHGEFMDRHSPAIRRAWLLLVLLCLVSASLIAYTTLRPKDSRQGAKPPPFKNFESASSLIFGPRKKVDPLELVGMPEELVLSTEQDISLGVGHNILNKTSPTGSGTVSKYYWTNIFLSPDPSSIFLANTLKKIETLGYGVAAPESRNSSFTYMGEELTGTSIKFEIKDSAVVKYLEVSYYDISQDDTLVITRSIPGEDFTDSLDYARGTAGKWSSDIEELTGWFLAGTALQPRTDLVEFSGSTHTATATIKIPAETYEQAKRGIDDGTLLAEFANIAPRQAFQAGNNSKTIFFRSGTRIEVSLTKPEKEDTESTIVITFDVRAP